MKQFIAKILPCTWVVAIALMPVSCMKEDTAACPVGNTVSLRFEYTHHTHGGDLLANLVEDIDVYIFDSNDRYVDNVASRRSALADGHTLVLSLDDGIYTIVAWGNLHMGRYNLITEHTRGGYSVEAAATGSDAIDLFHGMTTLEVTPKGNNEQTLSLIRNTHKVRIYLQGLPASRSIPGTDYSVRITGSNTLYDFANNPVGTVPATYTPSYTSLSHNSQQYVCADFKVQRLTVGDDVRICITEGDEMKLDESLTDRILSAYEDIETTDDLDRNYEYELYYTITPTGTIVFAGIEVIDWTGPTMPGGI